MKCIISKSIDFLSFTTEIIKQKVFCVYLKEFYVRPEISHIGRLPDLKRTIIRRERTLLCGNQNRLCHSPFSPSYESRKIFSTECRRATNNTSFEINIDFLSDSARFKSWSAKQQEIESIDRKKQRSNVKNKFEGMVETLKGRRPRG